MEVPIEDFSFTNNGENESQSNALSMRTEFFDWIFCFYFFVLENNILFQKECRWLRFYIRKFPVVIYYCEVCSACITMGAQLLCVAFSVG